MKRLLLIFTIIGLVSTISATRPKISSDKNVKSSGHLKQQTGFLLKLNNRSDIKFDILLTNTSDTSQQYPYTLNGNSIEYENIPVGIYDIQVTPETMPAYFFATVLPGCATLYEGYVGSTATVYCYNIAINQNCSSIVTNIEWVGHY